MINKTDYYGKKIKSFSWVDYGQSKRVDWWEINIELVINDKNYYKSDYLKPCIYH